MSEVTRVGKRGTIVIPAPLRKRYGLEEGREVLVEETSEGLLLRPAVTLPVEVYSKERRASFLLENTIDGQDYRRELRSSSRTPSTDRTMSGYAKKSKSLGSTPIPFHMKGLRARAVPWTSPSLTPTSSSRPPTVKAPVFAGSGSSRTSNSSPLATPSRKPTEPRHRRSARSSP